MKKIQKKYEEKVAKLTKRIDALKEEASQNESTLLELEKDYSTSLIEDDGKLEEIKYQINVFRQKLSDQKEQIQLLEAGTHPVMIEAANDAVREYAKERSKDQARGNRLNGELQKAKAVYLNTLAKAYVEDQKRLGERGTMRFILKSADDEVVSELLLDRERDEPMREIGGFFNWSDCLVTEKDMYVAVRSHQ